MRTYCDGEKAWWLLEVVHEYCEGSPMVYKFFGSFAELIEEFQKIPNYLAQFCDWCDGIHWLHSVSGLGLDGEEIELTSEQMKSIRALAVETERRLFAKVHEIPLDHVRPSDHFDHLVG